MFTPSYEDENTLDDMDFSFRGGATRGRDRSVMNPELTSPLNLAAQQRIQEQRAGNKHSYLIPPSSPEELLLMRPTK